MFERGIPFLHNYYISVQISLSMILCSDSKSFFARASDLERTEKHRGNRSDILYLQIGSMRLQ